MIKFYLNSKSDYYNFYYILIILNILIFRTKAKDNIILNDVIIVGEQNYRYINFVTTSKGVMILETSPDPGDKGRIFYGINSDGSSYFTDSSGKKSYFYKKNSESNTRTESEIGYFKLNSVNSNYSDKEYLISISQSYIEILDIENFEEDFKIYNTYEFILSGFTPNNWIWSFNNLIENKLNYFYLGYIIYKPTDGNYQLFLDKFSFEIDEGTQIISIKEISYIGVYTYDKKTFSCYFTENTYYICFLYYYDDTEDYYLLIAFDKNIKNIVDKKLENIKDLNSIYFFKAVHLRNEIGCLIYYLSDTQPPMIKIMEFDISNNEFISCIDFNITLNGNYSYNTEILLNDLIKVSDEKICFTSSSSDKTKLIIVIISFYNNNKLTIRYYILDIYNLLNYKFLFDIKLHLYNKYIAFGSSVCQNNECNSNSNEHFSILMFFSYPNCTESELNIIDYLNNNIENYILFNISEKGIIDNNLFGYIIYGANISSICDNGLKFKINGKEEYLIENSIILKDELIKLELPIEEYNITTFKIEYQIIITEQNYEIFNNYTNIINHFYEENSESEYWKNQLYYGKVNDYNFILNNKILTKGCDDICDICYSDNTYKCITCKNITTFENDSSSGKKQKKCLLSIVEEEETDEITNEDIRIDEVSDIKSEEINEKEITNETINEDIKKDEITHIMNEETEKQNGESIQNIKKSELKNEDNCEDGQKLKEENNKEKTCSNDDIINNNCNDFIIKDQQIQEIYDRIKNEYIKKNKTDEKIIITKNIIFEITNSNEQKQSLNQNISSIDLGECEYILKEKYNILEKESLIILKSDLKSDDLKATYVQYEIYNPNNLEKLDLSICNDYSININIPILLDPKTESLYLTLNESGYNLFNPNDSFYNDICTPFKSEYNTDILIEDRRKDFYESRQNLTLCQIGCIFQNYNSTTKKSNCKCHVENKNITTHIKDIQFYTKRIALHFLNTLKNSNFMVLKCYKLLLDISKLIKNIGFIIMTALLLFSIIFIFIHYIKYQKYIQSFINSILKNMVFVNNDKNKKNKKEGVEKIINNKNININKTTKNKNKKNNKFQKDKLKKKNTFIKDKKKNKAPPIKSKKINIERNNIFNIKFNINNSDSNFKDKLLKKNKLNSTSIIKIKKKKIKQLKENSTKTNKIEHKIYYNDQELNTLEYNLAIKIDKRTYFQYYWSLLKKKHPILFTFCPNNDYNLTSIKLSLFILSFSLYFTINAFFFTDDTMHKIYINKGSLNLLFQIPQILYSTVITSVINIIMKKLSLSELIILSLKKEKNVLYATNKSKKIIKQILIKFIIFFILSIILNLFFWYYISCFCAVYVNTQFLLIKDTLFSFFLSMIYPFGLNLLPGIFRFPALRAKNKDKVCLYKISCLLALLI